MKIRNGFVTNSSSSSFIISRRDDTIDDKDTVFNIIKNAHIEYKDIIHKAMMALVNEGLIDINSDEEYYQQLRKSEKLKAANKVVKKYGVDIYDVITMISYEIPPWCKCNTYTEYSNLVFEQVPSRYRDFIILDTRESIFTLTNSELEDLSETVSWYDDELDQELDDAYVDNNGVINCVDCEYQDKCENSEQNISCQLGNYDNLSRYTKYKIQEHAIQLGSLIVYSPENTMLNYVENKLRACSEEYCTHMG